MKNKSDGRVRVGIGGWTYEPWRGTFYPDKLSQKRELEFASSKLPTIEINGTYYGSQKPESFAKWHDETPGDFVFAVKGPRFATNRRVLSEAGASIERFFSGGVMMLKDKLGPINWQLMATKKLDVDDIAGFFKLLPKSVEGRTIRHAIEARHDSFKIPEFIALAREHQVAVIVAGDSKFPAIADVTAPFVYARIMGTSEEHETGYPKKALDAWAARAKGWAAGKAPEDLDLIAKPAIGAVARDVYVYVISGFKERNPAAAMALMDRL
jgi:uncharacterized protein YecE (DUF72 family)